MRAFLVAEILLVVSGCITIGPPGEPPLEPLGAGIVANAAMNDARIWSSGWHWEPAEVSVAPSQPLTFLALDDHTITSDDGRYDIVGDPWRSGVAVAIRFPRPGDVRIVCRNHAWMSVKVHVRSDPDAPTAVSIPVGDDRGVPISRNSSDDPGGTITNEVETLMIERNTTVSWVRMAREHPPRIFSQAGIDSGLIPKGAAFEHTFALPGRYPWDDAVSPTIHGVIVVT